jgi:hypothetical protein
MTAQPEKVNDQYDQGKNCCKVLKGKKLEGLA